MAIPSGMGDSAAKRLKCLFIQSPEEDAKAARTKQCVKEAVGAGLKAAAIACVVSAVPTLIAVRRIPWFKANIKYNGQALIISSASIATFAITVDKSITECARRNTIYNSQLR